MHPCCYNLAAFDLPPENGGIVPYLPPPTNAPVFNPGTMTMQWAFATMPSILAHIGWADPPKSEAQRWKEMLAKKAVIEKQVKKYGYVRDTFLIGG